MIDSVIITLIIIVILITTGWTWNYQFSDPVYNKIPLDDMLGQLRTGDIILFKALDNWNAPKIACYFGHIGVVWIDPDNGEPYIFEAAGTKHMYLLPNQNTRGIFLEPLVNRITKYKGHTYYKKLVGPDVDPCSLLPLIEYAMEHMYYDYNVASSCIRKGLGIERCNNATNCGEITMLSLIKLGILPLSEYDRSRPHHLRDMCYLEKSDTHAYMSPLMIVFDPFS